MSKSNITYYIAVPVVKKAIKRSEPEIACYVVQNVDNYTVSVTTSMSALRYIPPKGDQDCGDVISLTASGDFRSNPYFVVRTTKHGIPETTEKVREVLGDLEERLGAPADINQANRELFIELAEKRECLVGIIHNQQQQESAWLG